MILKHSPGGMSSLTFLKANNEEILCFNIYFSVDQVKTNFAHFGNFTKIIIWRLFTEVEEWFLPKKCKKIKVPVIFGKF